jgi:hypothetical protein
VRLLAIYLQQAHLLMSMHGPNTFCKDDKEQKTAFWNIASNFVLQFHREAEDKEKSNNQKRNKKESWTASGKN